MARPGGAGGGVYPDLKAKAWALATLPYNDKEKARQIELALAAAVDPAGARRERELRKQVARLNKKIQELEEDIADARHE